MPLKINMSTLQIRELFKNYIYSAIAKFGWHTECHFVNYNLDTNIFPFVNKAFPSILLRVVNFISFFLSFFSFPFSPQPLNPKELLVSNSPV